MENTTIPVTNIQFTNILARGKRDELRGADQRLANVTAHAGFMGAPSEEAARLASIVIYRLERPKGKHDAIVGKLYGERGVSKSTRRAAWNARPERVLSLQDKQDACQEVFSMMARGVHNEPDGIAQIFRACRDLLRINGGNHDQSKSDVLEDALNYRGAFTPRAAYRGSPERAKVAAMARELRRECFRAFEISASRKRRGNLRYHLETIRRMTSAMNPMATRCPIVEVGTDAITRKSAWQDRANSLRCYISAPRALDLSRLAEDMQTANAPEDAPEDAPRLAWKVAAPRVETITPALRRAMARRAKTESGTITLPTMTREEFAVIVANSSPYVAHLLERASR
jgi:hypothetical protein